MRDYFASFFSVLSRFRFVVVVVWLLLACASVWPALHFVQATSQKFDPPRGTAAHKAATTFSAYFPAVSNSQLTAVLLTLDTNSTIPVNGDFAAALTGALQSDLVPKACAEAKAPSGSVSGVLGYFTLVDQNPAMADGFVSPDGKSTVVVIPTTEFSSVEEWAGSLAHMVDEWVALHRLEFNDTITTVEVTGMPSLLYDSVLGVVDDLATMDRIALPLALVVLACVLHGLPLMIIPLFCAAVSFSLSFGVLFFVAQITPIASFSPPICLSVIIAFSFDCVAFIGSRWQEELASHRRQSKATEHTPPSPLKFFHKPIPASEEVNCECVETALRHSGRNVATSGMVLFACLVSLAVLPMQFISMVGTSAAITLFFTVITSLTLAPALLLCLRRFVSVEGLVPGVNFAALVPHRLRRCCRLDRDWLAVFWGKLGKLLTTMPAAFLATAVVVAATLTLSFFVQRIHITKDVTLMMPSSSPALHGLKHMMATTFPPGMAEPYYMVVVPQSGFNGTVWSPEFFANTYNCLHDLCETVDGIDEGNIIGVTQALGMPIPWGFAQKLLDPKNGWGQTEYGVAYRTLANYTVSLDGRASFTLIPTSFNPMENVTGFVSAVRSVLDFHSMSSNFTFMLAGDMVSMEDAIAGVLNKFPIIVGVAFGIVAVALLVAFRTVALPFRTLFSIVLTMGASFGLGTLVFVLGWLNLVDSNAFFWFTPICSFVVILGLATDYDIFLFTRVFENRTAGMSTADAIAHAVEKTGGIITAAGLIMAISFGGLCLSSILTVKQMGFMLATAVLWDTLIVRTFLVPSVLFMLSESNWWPRHFNSEKTKLLLINQDA